MRHWIGRVDIASGNIKALREFDSEEIVWNEIEQINIKQQEINKHNNELKLRKSFIKFNVPEFNKEIHGSLKKYLKLKNKLKSELNEEDRKLYHEPYLETIIPYGTKLVYLVVHEVD